MRDHDPLLTPDGAGREAKLSAARIRQLFDAGLLGGFKTANGWRLIYRSEIERLVAERRRAAEELVQD
jgi:hypothetical protein